MSKVDQMYKYRLEGMDLALTVISKAAAAGEDPVEALDREIKFRSRAKIAALATEKELVKASETIKELTIRTVLAASVIILWEQFGFGRVRAKRFMDAFYTYTRALGEGSVNWYTITDTLKDMTGIEIDLSDDNLAGKGDRNAG